MAEYHVGALQTYSTIQAALNVALSSGDIVTVHGGNYPEIVTTKAAGVTIRAYESDVVTINGAGKAANVFSIVHADTIIGLRVTGADSGRYNISLGANATIEDCYLFGGDRCIIATAVAGKAVFNRCAIRDNVSTSYSVYISRGSSGDIEFNFCMFIGLRSNGVNLNTGRYANFNHCLFVGSKNSAVICDATWAGASTVRNCVITACGEYDGSYYIVRNVSTASGTITVTKSCVMPNALNPDARFFSSGVTDAGDNVYHAPQFNANRRPGFICVVVDDHDEEYFGELAALCAANGGRATFAVSGTTTCPLDNAYWSDTWALRAGFVRDGHEIASHTMTHADLALSNAETLAYEVGESKSVIEAKISAELGVPYSCDTLVHPYNSDNEASQDAAKQAGYLCARGTSYEYKMENINIFDIASFSPSSLIGTTNIERNATALAEFACWLGGVFTLYHHLPTEYSVENWEILLNAIGKTNARLVTMREVAQYIRTGTDADGDGERWTRTFTDGADYRLKPTSRLAHGGAVITGANDGEQTDPWGNTMLAYPNIGADQYDYAPGFGPWSTCDASLPVDGQVFKSHTAPIAAKKLTVFPGVASAAQINEAKE